VASPSSAYFHWPSFSGPYSRLLGVRAVEWLGRFDAFMLASVEAQENLDGVEASIGDLIPISLGAAPMTKS
jgi:hypothetical protein